MEKKELRFLLATDIHLGHAENHLELGRDSYEAFQEVLSIAKSENVDFLLLGGDLFDEVNPSQKTIFKCLTYLRDSIFGDKQLEIRVKGIVPNFSNVNLNISLPIFTIHGNHDYPSNDFGKISVCDLLHASNYVNYFGKHLNISEQGIKKVVVKPLIFQKTETSIKMAIYGLGYIKDHKLNKMLQENEITFEEPKEKDETLCILILHQNKYKGKGVGASYENCVHPQQFPKWMDLIIWGHEHQPIYKVTTESEMKIFQPGSTVPTSYIDDEALKKQCAIVTVRPNKEFEVRSILLEKSYRPMVIKSFILTEIDTKFGIDGKVNYDNFFDNVLSETLGELEKEGLVNKKPIIRIKIDYTSHEIIRLIRIEEKYRELVANSNKIFAYTQKKIPKKILALEDNEVLDMIKKKEIPRNATREAELTQEILEIFAEEVSKTKLNFFNFEQLKELITEHSNPETKGSINDVKHFYNEEIEKKCKTNIKEVQTFHKNNDIEFKRIHEKLLKHSQQYLKGQKDENFQFSDIKADMARLKASYQEKEKNVQSMFNETLLRPGAQLETQTQTQIASKSTKISEDSKNDKRRSSLINSHRESDHSHKHEMSDEEDCCLKVEREEYRENDTRVKFDMANEMAIKKGKDPKGKKSVKFEK